MMETFAITRDGHFLLADDDILNLSDFLPQAFHYVIGLWIVNLLQDLF
jgi:hypothetical protein